MRIALDATYSVTTEPSGVAVYSREMLHGLPRLFPQDEYVGCYRWKQWWRRPSPRGALLIPPLPTFRSDIFHALNQRVDQRPARRVVATFHDLFVMTAEYSSPEFRRRFTRQAQLAAENSDLIIAVSRFTAGQVEELLKIPASRIRVVPHGVHPPRCQRRHSDVPFILSVGTIQARKNTARLVSAFERMPPPWRLVLAGSALGHGAAEVLRQIETSAVASRIEVTGYVPSERLSQLYASASIFAFPSLDEGFGMPVLEAMAHEVPVLTSNTSALQEVADGAALLVNPNDVEQIADGLQILAEDSKLRSRLVKMGKARAYEYTWERAAEATHAIYQELF